MRGDDIKALGDNNKASGKDIKALWKDKPLCNNNITIAENDNILLVGDFYFGIIFWTLSSL